MFVFKIPFGQLHLNGINKSMDPLEFGWTSEGPSGVYCPVSLPSMVEAAPSDIRVG